MKTTQGPAVSAASICLSMVASMPEITRSSGRVAL
jgi:hypothetical protein